MKTNPTDGRWPSATKLMFQCSSPSRAGPARTGRCSHANYRKQYTNTPKNTPSRQQAVPGPLATYRVPGKSPRQSTGIGALADSARPNGALRRCAIVPFCHPRGSYGLWTSNRFLRRLPEGESSPAAKIPVDFRTWLKIPRKLSNRCGAIGGKSTFKLADLTGYFCHVYGGERSLTSRRTPLLQRLLAASIA